MTDGRWDQGWIWEDPRWPDFQYDASRLAAREAQFRAGAFLVLGATRSMAGDDKITLIVEMLSDEAVQTSAIEGERLNRDSVQASVRRQLGLSPADRRQVTPAERGIADLMVAVSQTYQMPLSEEMLFGWHRQVMAGRGDIPVGAYRSDEVEVVSGPIHRPKVHYRGPPQEQVRAEMIRFIGWFNATATGGPTPLPAVERAAVAHFWYEIIHPFEDGNGRIGRALAEKSLAQSLQRPTLLTLSGAIQQERAAYYAAFEQNNRSVGIDNWMAYFSALCVRAQGLAVSRIDFIIARSKLFDGYRNRLNPRQMTALLRMTDRGLEGFTGGMSADKYIKITGASPATASRDLSELVQMGALIREGQSRSTRYHLPIPTNAYTPPRPEQTGEATPIDRLLAAFESAADE